MSLLSQTRALQAERNDRCIWNLSMNAASHGRFSGSQREQKRACLNLCIGESPLMDFMSTLAYMIPRHMPDILNRTHTQYSPSLSILTGRAGRSAQIQRGIEPATSRHEDRDTSSNRASDYDKAAVSIVSQYERLLTAERRSSICLPAANGCLVTP